MKVVFVISNERINKFMHTLEVFEPFKSVAQNLVLDLKSFSKEQANYMNELFLENDQYKLLACFNQHEIYWTDSKIKVYSDGKRWALAKDYIKYYQSIL